MGCWMVPARRYLLLAPIVRLPIGLISAGLIAGGCSFPQFMKGNGDSAYEGPQPELEFVEGISVPVTAEETKRGIVVRDVGVASVRLVNHGTKAATITKVAPVEERGLRVEYLGHTTCARGCAGADHWSPDVAEFVQRGLDGLYPVQLDPGQETRFLVFRLNVQGAAGVDRLLRKCRLSARSVVLTLQGGRPIRAKVPGVDHVVGIHLVAPYPSGYEKCG